MIKNILMAYDGSEPSDNAFEYARFLGRKLGATVEVLLVVQGHFIGDEVETTAMLEEGARQAERAIRRLRHRSREDETELRFQTVVGRPAEKIVAEASSSGADIIVMGYHGMSHIERWLSGSTTRQVLGSSQCPILIVR